MYYITKTSIALASNEQRQLSYQDVHRNIDNG